MPDINYPEINYPDMVKSLAKPGDAILASLTPELCHLMHMAIGVSGEASELLEAITEMFPHEKVVEELGDIEFYLEGIRQAYGIPRYLDNEVMDCVLPTTDSRKLSDGLVIKAGELLDCSKRIFIYQKPNYGRDQIIVALDQVELCLFYIRKNLGISWIECLEANVKKLGKRYQEGRYSNDAANHRADKTGTDEEEPLVGSPAVEGIIGVGNINLSNIVSEVEENSDGG